MKDSAHEPANELEITSLETLKVLSDPLRARIVDLLRGSAQTVKQLAFTLELPPKKLYYHVNLMEQHGLIRVVSTRVVSGIIEKQYRATAYLFMINPHLFSSAAKSNEGVSAGLSLMFDVTRNQLEQSVQSGLVDLAIDASIDHRLLFKWTFRYLSPEQLASFHTRFRALLEEFDTLAEDPASPDVQPYRILLSLFPIRHTAPAPGAKGD